MIAKPPHVFARDHEWALLTDFVQSDYPQARLGVVSGRRRQGKSYLLEAVATATEGFYFTASETTSVDALRDFGSALADYAGASAPYQLEDWDDALRALFETVRRGPIVIDEFPYLIKADPAIPSLVQRAVDPRGRAHVSDAKLLLCGSAMSVMGGLLSGQAPLRGRAGLELVIRPFDYTTAAKFWDIDDHRLAVLVHSIVGGTPAYRTSFIQGRVPRSFEEFDRWVASTVLRPGLPLFREARYLLAEEAEIRDLALYNAVLGAIAAGNSTRGGIANHVGRKDSDLGHPLTVLADVGLVRREHDPFHGKRRRYRITEPLITFYEAVMRRSWTQLEQGYADRVWTDARPTFFSQVVGPHFEELCRAFVMRAGSDLFGTSPGEVSAGIVSDPTNRTQIEVDVVALAPGLPGERRKVLSLGEAKWNTTMNEYHLERLSRARSLLAAKGYDASDAILACYSGAGFDDGLREAAARGRVTLVDLDRLYAVG